MGSKLDKKGHTCYYVYTFLSDRSTMIAPGTTQNARQIFHAHGGTMRTGEALDAGIHPRTLYAMRDSGELEVVSRGVYRLADLPPLSEPDLAAASLRVPKGVVCLISALAFHDLTTQVPHAVHLAVPRNTKTPRLKYPPIEVYRFAEEAYHAGIETHSIDDVEIRVYSAEKTLADCFKYRNKIGLGIATEALQNYRRRKGARLQQVLEYARVCRVENVMRPYLQAIQ